MPTAEDPEWVEVKDDADLVTFNAIKKGFFHLDLNGIREANQHPPGLLAKLTRKQKYSVPAPVRSFARSALLPFQPSCRLSSPFFKTS